MSKTILITGASSGIGKATAKLFHEKGWNVIATMRSPEKETELTKLDNILIVRLDVLDLESIKTAVDSGIEKFGKLDVILNNAGYGAYGPLEATPRDNVLRQFNVNVIGMLDVTQAILPHFRANKEGILINISSIGGKITFPTGSLYHGTKFAVEGISEALSFEMEYIGCKVKIIEPGVIDTDFGGRSFNFNNDASMKEYQGLVADLATAFEKMGGDSSPASLAAEVIYTAATDGSNQLRYTVGNDAVTMLSQRAKSDDQAFLGYMKSLFGI